MNQAGHHCLILRLLDGLAFRRPKLLSLWVGMMIAASTVSAATNIISSYRVRTWQADDGLPQNSVHAIAQTPDGFLWVGTQEGLMRFDGVRFVGLDGTAPRELAHGWIAALCTGRDGSLWVACDGFGLVRWKAGQVARFSETDGLLSNRIQCLLETTDGALWIGSEGGLTRYQDGRFVNFTERNGLGANSVRGLAEDRQGNLRIATLRGLSTLNRQGRIHTFNIRPGTPANALKFVCAGRDGRIWTGSNEGLNCVDGEKVTTYGGSEGLPDDIVTAAFEDRNGQVWAGTYHGVARLVEGKVISRPSRGGAFADQIYTIFEDGEGNIWVGGQDGLHLVAPARVMAYTTQQGLTRNNVMSVLEDHAGTVWIGTWGGGLNRLQDGQLDTYAERSLSLDKILALHESRDGSLWVGTDFVGGLNRLKGEPKNSFPRLAGLIAAAIRVVHEDRAGTLWIGTSRGLNSFHGGKFKTYTTGNGLAGNLVLALLEDRAGHLWIGTDGGLNCWDGRSFSNLSAQSGFSHLGVNALYEDAEGTLWIGSKGAGLGRCRDGAFSWCTTRQGLFNDEIYEILEDDFGYFWMSCRKGIFRVSKKQLEEQAQGDRSVVTCTSFGRADGLPTVQCNGVAKPSGWKGRDGRLWFATIGGVVVVEPAIKTNEKPPPVLIEEVIASGNRLHSPFAAGDSINLNIPPGRGAVEIHYTALSFQAPEKNRFRYKLDGVDQDWVEAGANRAVSYNNLSPGPYRFRVMASNNDGVWNERGATLHLSFAPFYWQTLWFKVAIAGAFVLVLALLYRLRVAQLHALEHLRIEIAANLHDDVGARLTKLAMVTEVVDRDTREADPAKPYLRNIFKTVREITQAMDEIVWTINPRNDTLDHLANYILQYAQEYFQDTRTSCRLDVPAQLPDRAISTETRHNLFMAVKETLNNTLKHADATEVRLGLSVADGRMEIIISDNGRGFVVAEGASKGNGLENMRRRLESIGGRCSIESQPGQGTRVKMEAETK